MTGDLACDHILCRYFSLNKGMVVKRGEERLYCVFHFGEPLRQSVSMAKGVSPDLSSVTSLLRLLMKKASHPDVDQGMEIVISN